MQTDPSYEFDLFVIGGGSGAAAIEEIGWEYALLQHVLVQVNLVE